VGTICIAGTKTERAEKDTGEKEDEKVSEAKRWAVCDCETDSFDGREVSAFIWAIHTSDGERFMTYSTAEVVDYLRGFDGIVYAHNGGKFDWLMKGIVEHLEQGVIKIINGRLAKAKIGKAELRDSWLCLPAPLAAFGEKDEFDYSILDRAKKYDRKRHAAKIEKYLHQDCVALYNAMSAYVARHGHRLTQAGAAMATWEKMGGEVRRYGEAHDARFRPYYFGGRCEAFTRGETFGKYQIFDINSSYPAAMKTEHCAGVDYYPVKDPKKAHPSSFWHIYGISRGALPLRNDWGGLYFPNDETPRDYFCTGWEIHTALEFGKLDIIEARGVAPRRFESFAPFVNYHFEKRKEAKARGDEIDSLLLKLTMNSLYGKFAAQPDNYKDYKIVAGGVRPAGWSPEILLDDFDIISRPSQVKEYYDVAVGASITGFARAALMRGIFSSKGVIYCDTDSVVCKEFGGIQGDELGQWKYEGEFTEGYIVGKKSYAFNVGGGNWKTAHKGISKLDIQVSDIIRAAKGEIVEIQKSAPNVKLSGEQVFFSRKLKIT
jgi:hypothetical protein